MARRGKFGRSPSAGPDLSSTLVSIAREMMNAEASNLMDAWQHGGQFEGRPATDARVLAFWKDRAANVSKDDPLYDQYHNTYIQTDYSIQESKQALLYTQGKINEQQMAQFYLNWAKKVDKNSEFYRVLQTDAAKFLNAAASRGRASANKAKDAAYQAAQANASKGAAAGNMLQWALEGMANVNGLLGSSDTKGLANLSDPGVLVGLLNQLNAHPDNPIFQVNGQVWTGKDLMDQVAKLDPNFFNNRVGGPTRGVGQGSPTLSLGYIQHALSVAHNTYIDMANRATAAGKTGDAKKYAKQATAVTETVREVGVWGLAPAYNQIIAERDRILKDPNATGEEKLAAAEQAAQQLNSLAGKAQDMRTRQTLLNEAAANAGDTAHGNVATFGEDYLGTKTQAPQNEETATSPANGENAKVSALVARLSVEHQYATADPTHYVYTYGKRDAQGVFHADASGTEVGVVEAANVQRLGLPTTVVSVPSQNGAPLMVTIVGHPITTVAYDANGNALQGARVNGMTATDLSTAGGGAGNWIGTSYTYQLHGQTVRLYGIPDGHGGTTYTTVPPWATGATEKDNPDGSVVVNVSSLVNQAGKSGVLTIPPKSAGDQPHTVYDPAVVAISNIRTTAGSNPETDFAAPILASVMASGDPQGTAKALVQNPVAMQVLYNQEVAAANGDQNRLNQIISQNTAVLGQQVGDLWDGERAGAGLALQAAGLSRGGSTKYTEVQQQIGAPGRRIGNPNVVPPTIPLGTLPPSYVGAGGTGGQMLRNGTIPPTPVQGGPAVTPPTDLRLPGLPFDNAPSSQDFRAANTTAPLIGPGWLDRRAGVTPSISPKPASTTPTPTPTTPDVNPLPEPPGLSNDFGSVTPTVTPVAGRVRPI